MKTRLIITLAFLLSACGTVPPVPEDQFHRLGEPRDVAAALAGAPIPDLLVKQLRSDGIHADRALLLSSDPAGYDLQRYHYHFWADPPPRLLQQQLIRHLRAAGARGRVSEDPGLLERPWRIGGRLLAFEELRPEEGPHRVTVAVELSVAAAGRSLIREFRRMEQVEADTMHAVVAAYDRAVAAILEQFTAELKAFAGEEGPR